MTIAQGTRRSGTEALRALSHPLRLRLLDVLRRDGPLMVTELAAAVGESAASTSYHLSQLARHGYIRLRPDLARDGRERWWEAPEEAAWDSRADRGSDPPGTARPDVLMAGMQAAQVQAFLAERAEAWSEAWQGASTVGSYRLRLTAELTARLHADFLKLYRRYRSALPPDAAADDAAEVTVVFNAFPRRNGG